MSVVDLGLFCVVFPHMAELPVLYTLIRTWRDFSELSNFEGSLTSLI